MPYFPAFIPRPCLFLTWLLRPSPGQLPMLLSDLASVCSLVGSHPPGTSSLGTFLHLVIGVWITILWQLQVE